MVNRPCLPPPCLTFVMGRVKRPSDVQSLAPRVTWCDAAKCLQLGVKRTSLVLARNDVNVDP